MSRELVHNDAKFYNQKLTIPIDGTVQLGPRGEVTVSDEAAKILLTIPKWIDPKEAVAAAKKQAETHGKAKKESKLVTEPVGEDSTAFGIDLNQLDGFSTSELLEIAAASGINVPAPMQASTVQAKKGLVTFLRNQLKKKLEQ